MERPGNRPRAFRTYAGESRSSDGDERLGCRHAETRPGPRTCATTTVPPEEHRSPINPHQPAAVKVARLIMTMSIAHAGPAAETPVNGWRRFAARGGRADPRGTRRRERRDRAHAGGEGRSGN